MYVHGLQPVAVWHLTWVQSLADECQRRDVASLAGLDPSVFCRAHHQRMVQEMQQALRKIYFTPSDTRDAGYIETEHFGVRFPHCSSYVDLTCVSQRWPAFRVIQGFRSHCRAEGAGQRVGGW
ncbi:hypothetical protein [Streptomyces sp. NBC_00564]|uniref:hypothetical protein n=1 Tax=Streptomyces sp. NBC_00564 TaxID=2903663 RepID=UPI00352D60CB|nr:hypothetical protein OG256_38535 [Streptomyces sp. NBC_00564]